MSHITPSGNGTSGGGLADIVATATSGGALTVGKHNPVNAASGPKPMTLANATSAGQRVSFEKTDSSTNPVAVTLNLRGTTGSTLVASWQNESIELVGKADGSWWPVAGHKTKSSIDVVTAARQGSGLRGSVVASSCEASPTNSLTSTGTHRVPHFIEVDCADLRFVFANYQVANSTYADTDNTGAITISASVEDAGGVIRRLTFNGRYSVTIDGGTVTSDPLSEEFAAGTLIYVRVYITYAGSAFYGGRFTFTGHGGFTATTDLTAPGAASITDSVTTLYGPVAIIGNPTDATKRYIAGVGDSICAGQGSANQAGGLASNGNGGGWLEQAAHAAGRGCVNVSRSADGASGAVLAASHIRRYAFIGPAAVAFCAYGRNDITGGRTATQLEGDLVSHWKLMTRRGALAVQSTITPRTTSTDSWATTANQTVASSAEEAVRVAVNTWLRAGAPLDPTALTPVAVGTSGAVVCAVYDSTKTLIQSASGAGHPLSGVIELTDAVESARNSGLWKVDGTANKYTSDGLHPSSFAHGLMAGAAPVTAFG